MQAAGINAGETALVLYQINWNEEGYNKGVLPTTTKDYPCFSMPTLNDGTLNYVESYIKFNHPETIDEALSVVRHLFKVVSDASVEVSQEFDFELLEVK